jgi:hypothetical protein
VHSGVVMPGMTASNINPLRYHSQRVRPSMPHFNSKGEFIKSTNSQVRRSKLKISGLS